MRRSCLSSFSGGAKRFCRRKNQLVINSGAGPVKAENLNEVSNSPRTLRVSEGVFFIFFALVLVISNLFPLSRGDYASLFPSGHVASVAATVVGRDHYDAGALAGALVGATAFAVASRVHRMR